MRVRTKILLLLTVTAFSMACGYSKPQAALPAISQLNPASATAGSAAFHLEVDGTNFVSGAVINFNGMAQVTTFVSATKLEATIPATAITTPTTVLVTVSDPANGSIYGNMGPVTSTPMSFMVN